MSFPDFLLSLPVVLVAALVVFSVAFALKGLKKRRHAESSDLQYNSSRG